MTTNLTGSDQKAGGTYVSFAWTGHSIELYCPGRILFCPETPPQELEACLPTTTKIRIASEYFSDKLIPWFSEFDTPNLREVSISGNTKPRDFGITQWSDGVPSDYLCSEEAAPKH